MDQRGATTNRRREGNVELLVITGGGACNNITNRKANHLHIVWPAHSQTTQDDNMENGTTDNFFPSQQRDSDRNTIACALDLTS